MRLAYLCFIGGAAFGVAGMSLGIFMGISQDFTLTPVHAHINLLGFVSLMLYGLYYRGAPTTGHLAWLQAGMSILGVPLMAGGLASMLVGCHGGLGEFITIAGSLFTIGALGMFLVKVLRDAGGCRGDHSALRESDVPNAEAETG
jgi:hypothetical protein